MNWPKGGNAGQSALGVHLCGTERSFMTRANAESIIEARGLTKTYGAAAVVRDLSFDVPRGSITGFLGPNGAGKTTTMRMILGLVRPDQGTATILGQPYHEIARPMRLVGAVLEGTVATHGGAPAIT
jgi:ABC-2 type transport system ATP-binding protein